MSLQQKNTHATEQLMGEAVKYKKCFCVISVGVNQWGSADINEVNLTYGRESVSLFPMMTTNVWIQSRFCRNILLKVYNNTEHKCSLCRRAVLYSSCGLILTVAMIYIIKY